jgi:hypothetical protein
MMRQKRAEITLPIDQVYEEVGFGGPLSDLHSYGYWNACRNHIKDWDTLYKQGIEVDFEVNAQGRVDEVTFRLTESWRSLMEGR